jgi:hypothetical protein
VRRSDRAAAGLDHLHDDVLEAAAALPGAITVDVRSAFAGHNISSALSTGYLNGLTVPNIGDNSGEDNSPFGMGTFHPNPAGTQAYGSAVSAALSKANYSW